MSYYTLLLDVASCQAVFVCDSYNIEMAVILCRWEAEAREQGTCPQWFDGLLHPGEQGMAFAIPGLKAAASCALTGTSCSARSF